MTSFALPRPPQFTLAESSAFLAGFRAVTTTCGEHGLDLTFALDGGWQPVGLHLSESGDALRVDILANPESATIDDVQRNLERLLGLTLDFDRYRAIGERDPIVGRLQRDNPAVRPVLFPTAWEAAVWSILSQRTRRVQAVAIKRRLAETCGTAVTTSSGTVIHGFPGPESVRGLTEIRGLPLQKIEWLHGLAEAAMMGTLDCDELAAMSQSEGMRALQKIPGIGPFSAELILARGAGNPDIFPMHEPMLHDIMTRLYGTADTQQHQQIAETWRPYRSWVSFLLRVSS